ncbi:MAG: DNA polymerase III subunit delta [Rhodospirillales bacterium]
MTAQQFIQHLKQREPAAAYLFLGPEPYHRDLCRRALIARVLADPEERENGLTRIDLEESTLESAIEDARSPSLFTAKRVLVISNAEAALPRTKAAGSEEQEAPKRGSNEALARYLSDPTPGVVLVFESSRYDFQGEDKKKLDRVRAFYSAVPAVVELPHLTPQDARRFAADIARRAGLNLGPEELELLVDALGGEAARIVTEIEKLRLWAAGGRKISAEVISKLVPEARDATIFALVSALGRGDRAASLDVLDTLVRQSEYLPLALSFLGTQFRLAMAAREAGLRTPQQILSHFSKLGVQMWPARAEQVYQTLSKFSKAQIATALKRIYGTDKTLRDVFPDARIVMEGLILELTASRR